jgi:hypothetical protein
VGNKEKALDPNIALFILVDGMLLGEFTGNKLGTFVNGSKTDFLGARKVINGRDRREHIAGLANSWLSKLGSLESVSLEIANEDSPQDPAATEEILGIEELILKQAMSS